MFMSEFITQQVCLNINVRHTGVDYTASDIFSEDLVLTLMKESHKNRRNNDERSSPPSASSGSITGEDGILRKRMGRRPTNSRPTKIQRTLASKSQDSYTDSSDEEKGDDSDSSDD